MKKDLLKLVKSLEVLELGPDQCLLIKVQRQYTTAELLQSIEKCLTSFLRCKIFFYDERIESIKVVKAMDDDHAVVRRYD